MHGLDQSQALTRAAQELSAAKQAVAAGFAGADTVFKHAHKNYRKALQEYIDPHKVHRSW